MKLPSDLAKEIGRALNWEIAVVNKAFEFEEDKQGFFIVSLRQGLNLSTTDSKTMCNLAEDLDGKYLQGQRKWSIPGPYAKTAEGPQKTDYPKKPPFKLRFIQVDSITVPQFLPTRALIKHERLSEITNSIKKHGLQYPIKVRPGAEPDTYELKDGYLRLKSVKQLGWKRIPAEIRKTTDQEVIVESIITNKHRIQEDPITIAKKLEILVNAFGYTQEKLAEELGVSQPWISNTIRLLGLPKDVQHYLALDNVSFKHALLLLQLETPETQVKLAKETVERGFSTRELDAEIQHYLPVNNVTQSIDPKEHEPVELGEGPSERFEPAAEVRRTVKTERKTDEPEDTSLVDEPTETTEYTGEAREEPKSEPLLTAMEWECPECHQVILIHHIDHANGKISHELVKQKRE